jgi:hypothetical protein
MRVALAIVVTLLSGFAAFAFMRWAPSMVENRMAPFTALLERAGVEASDHVRASLERQAARRHFWGAVGGGIGYGSVFIWPSIAHSEVIQGASGLLGVVGFFFGAAVGQSSSALFPADHPRGRIRVTAMQRHGLVEYIQRREIALEVGVGLLGWVSAAVGGLVLTGLASLPAVEETAPSLLFEGAILAFVATTSVLVQRRLVVAPLRAADEDGLVTADVVLAVGLRDLLTVTVATMAMVAWMTVFLPGRGWWLVALYAFAAGAAFLVGRPRSRRPYPLPVASRLTVRSPSA